MLITKGGTMKSKDLKQNLYLPSEEYFKLPALSYSGLKDLEVSPEDYYYYHILKNEKGSSAAQELGSAVHLYCLEPEKFDENVGVWNRVKRGKEWDKWPCNDRLVFKPEDFDKIQAMGDRVLNHPVAGELIKKGEIERSLVWTHEDFEVSCKARPDVMVPDLAIVADLKTTRVATWREFQSEIARFKYHYQAAWYLEGANAVQDKIEYEEFVWICIENTPPYKTALYSADWWMIEKARDEIRPLVELYAKCKADDHWPGCEENIQEISLPTWAT